MSSVVPLLFRLVPALALMLLASGVQAQSFRVQCPAGTLAHPAILANDSAAVTAAAPKLYDTVTQWGRTDGKLNPTPAMANPAIKCQQVAGGDGYATMADGTQTYLFGFGPLSGLADIYAGKPGTQAAKDFMVESPQSSGSPSTLIGMPDQSFTFNGAIGLTSDADAIADGTCTQSPCLDGHVDPRPIMDVGVMNANQPAPLMAIDEDDEFFLTLTNVGMIMRPDLFEQHTIHFHGYPNASSFYDGVPDASIAISIGGSFSYYYLAPDAGTYFWHCHISPPEHLQMGMVGQLYVRPRQNLASRPYAALAAYEAPLSAGHPVSTADYEQVRKRCGGDILCSSPLPATAPATGTDVHATNKSGTPTLYAYNDGDGSTSYDVEYPIQIHGFDPNFHFVGMTFNPESFTDMKDKYFLLNGRSYPDTVAGHTCLANDTFPNCAGSAPGTFLPAGTVVSGPMQTQSSDGTLHSSQPLPTIINIPAGGRALLRISDLSVSEYSTLASLGVPMRVIALNARLLRDTAGNDMTYLTNSITLAGGESLDVILDASDTTKYTAGQKFYLYTPNLDHLSNDAENFGGMMTEVNICKSVDPVTKACSNV
jgi:FtsP/CotA-like multicopper oxidase with cupredoxin domain